MGEPQDRAQMIQDLTGDNPKCLVCNASTRHLDAAPFCSRSCEHKAMNFQGGTVAERFARNSLNVDPFYFSTRIVDGGLWPGTSHKSKVTRRNNQIKKEYGL